MTENREIDAELTLDPVGVLGQRDPDAPEVDPRAMWARLAEEHRAPGHVAPPPAPLPRGTTVHPETLELGTWSRDDITRHYERDLLTVLITDSDRCEKGDVAGVFPIVDASDFLTPQAGTLFEWLRRMWQRFGSIDPVVLFDAMIAKGPSCRALAEFASRLWTTQGDAQHWRILTYASEVHERAQQRRLVQIAEVEREALSGRSARLPDGTWIEAGTPAAEVIGATDAARRRLAKATNGASTSARLSTFREKALAAEEIGGLSFGLTALDEILRGGAHNGHLIVVGARPGMGKTGFLLTAMEQWTHAGRPGIVFSLEMKGEELYGRVLSSVSGLSADEWDTDWDRVLDAADIVDRLAVNVADAPSMTLEQIRAECDRRRAEGTLHWIMVDYLTLMGTDPSIRDQYLKVGANSTGLKAIAKDYDIPVILAAQLNRDVEKRQNKRPVQSDLRDAGQIEQDANVILFLYREHVYDETADPTEAEIIVAKQRGGRTGTVLAAWNGPLTRFEDPVNSADVML
jgi:replicative DNA helicase